MSTRLAVVTSDLSGREVALAGHFSSMTQEEAGRVVEAAGGRWVRVPRTATDYLVIGQEGWPFERSGHVTRNVAVARRLRSQGSGLEVIPEQRFLELAGLEPARDDEPRRMYSTAELARVLAIPGPRIRSWVRRGLIRPESSDGMVDWYDFRQVTALRQLRTLTAGGARPETILASLEQIRGWLPDAEDALEILARFVEADEVMLDDGSRATLTGQLVLPLSEVGAAEPPVPVSLPMPFVGAGEEWLAEGDRLIDDGDLDGAERAFKKAILTGGVARDGHFRLGEVLARKGDKEAALAEYTEAVELDAGWAEGWGGVSGVLVELERFDDAIEAGERALECDPENPSAHFHLALALLARGRTGEARLHGRIYLRHDSTSATAEQLRDLLEL